MNAEDRKQVLKQSHAAQTTTEIQQQGVDTSQHKDKEDPEDLEQVLNEGVQEIQKPQVSQATKQSKSATSQLTEMQAYATEASEPKMNAEDRKQVLKQSHAAQTTTEIQQQGVDTSQHKDKEDPEDLEQVLKRVQEIQNSKRVKAKSKMENHADEPSSIWKQITEFILLAMQKSDDNDDNDNEPPHTDNVVGDDLRGRGSRVLCRDCRRRSCGILVVAPAIHEVIWPENVAATEAALKAATSYFRDHGWSFVSPQQP